MTTVVSRGETISIGLMSENESDREQDTMTSGVCGCYNGACPEVVAVTHEENTYIIGGAVVTSVITFTPADPVTTKTGANIAIQLQAADSVDLAQRMQLMLHWCDNNYDFGVITGFPPPTPGWSQKTVFTDAAGAFELDVENIGPPDRIWYLIVTVGGSPTAVGPIGLGAS